MLQTKQSDQPHFGKPNNRQASVAGNIVVIVASLILLCVNISFLVAEQPSDSANESILGVYALVLYVWLAWLVLIPLVLSMLIWTLARRSQLQPMSYWIRVTVTALALLSIVPLIV